MAELTFEIERVPSLESTAFVKVSGAIDTKTVVGFQDRLDDLQKEGHLRFILDMEGIKYVNSTGLGALVNVADNLENAGGGMVLIKIHPKVKVVFDMLGLNAFFKIFKNESEALEHFKGSAGADAAPPEVPAPAPVPTPSAAPPAPPAPRAAPRAAPPTPPPVAEAPASPNQIQAKPLPGEAGAYTLACNQCRVNLTLRKPGSYKCPRCSSFLKLAADGTVQFFRRKTAPALRMTLACTEECKEGLAEFIAVLVRRTGFPAGRIDQLKSAVTATCTEIIEKAYGNQPNLTYNVMISSTSSEIKIQIADYGKFINPAGNSVFSAAREAMSSFEHKQHPKGGNVVNMSMSAE